MIRLDLETQQTTVLLMPGDEVDVYRVPHQDGVQERHFHVDAVGREGDYVSLCLTDQHVRELIAVLKMNLDMAHAVTEP